MHTLFKIANQELTKINTWFVSNMISLNVKKTQIIFLFKEKKTIFLPLRLTKLEINGQLIERVGSIKCLDILMDECLLGKKIEYIKNE